MCVAGGTVPGLALQYQNQTTWTPISSETARCLPRDFLGPILVVLVCAAGFAQVSLLLLSPGWVLFVEVLFSACASPPSNLAFADELQEPFS